MSGTEAARVRTKITNTKRLQVIGGNLHVGTLLAFLDGLPDDGVVSVTKESPDRPGEQTVLRIEVTTE